MTPTNSSRLSRAEATAQHARRWAQQLLTMLLKIQTQANRESRDFESLHLA